MFYIALFYLSYASQFLNRETRVWCDITLPLASSSARRLDMGTEFLWVWVINMFTFTLVEQILMIYVHLLRIKFSLCTQSYLSQDIGTATVL